MKVWIPLLLLIGMIQPVIPAQDTPTRSALSPSRNAASDSYWFDYFERRYAPLRERIPQKFLQRIERTLEQSGDSLPREEMLYLAGELFTRAMLESIRKTDARYYFVSQWRNEELLRREVFSHVYREGLSALRKIVPLFVKDNTDIRGLATFHSIDIIPGVLKSDLRRFPRSLYNANLIDSLIAPSETGPVYLVAAKTQLCPYSTGTMTHTIHPYFTNGAEQDVPLTNYWPGGSSGGSAVSVFLGVHREIRSKIYDGEVVRTVELNPVATGSDTGGSVRIPAALISGFIEGMYPVGLKMPNHFFREGIHPVSDSFDSAGLIFTGSDRTIDFSPVDRIRHGFDGSIRDSIPFNTGREHTALRPGFVAGIPGWLLDVRFINPKIREDFNRVLDRLESRGVEIRKISLPTQLQTDLLYYVFATGIQGTQNRLGELNSLRKGIAVKMLSLYDPVLIQGILGSFASRLGLEPALQRLYNRKKEQSLESIRNADLVLQPTLTYLPYPVTEGIHYFHAMNSNRLTVWANLADCWAMTLPSQTLGSALQVAWTRQADYEEIDPFVRLLLEKHPGTTETPRDHFAPPRPAAGSPGIPASMSLFQKIVYFSGFPAEQRALIVREFLKLSENPRVFLRHFFGRELAREMVPGPETRNDIIRMGLFMIYMAHRFIPGSAPDFANLDRPLSAFIKRPEVRSLIKELNRPRSTAGNTLENFLPQSIRFLWNMRIKNNALSRLRSAFGSGRLEASA
jgi:Asp-tRNA(Asn)/Glu-tRNA(Gln) amidotransferase A subunit family amidase